MPVNPRIPRNRVTRFPEHDPRVGPPFMPTAKERVKYVLSAVAIILGIVAFAMLYATGMEQTEKDVRKWAQDFDFRHCTGKFDTPACHERKNAANANAYTEELRKRFGKE